MRTSGTEIKLPAELYTRETLPDGRIITYCTMRQQVLHCIGMVGSCSQRHRPYRRHGRTFYRPWRNYFGASAPDAQWEELCEAGYANHGVVSDRGVLYWITRKGLDWVGEQLDMTIYDEED